MTPGEKETAKKTARIIRTARKTRGLTQVETAKQLGISQSALSKMENALLIPSIYHWFSFCKLAAIPTDSHLSGYVDLGEPVVQGRDTVPGSFRLPRKFRINQGSSVRSMFPFISHFRKTLGEHKLQEYLEEVKVDSDFFVRLDHTISLEFCLDISRTMIKAGVLQPDGLKTMVACVSQPESHGVLRTSYEKSEAVGQLLKNLISQSHFYEANFEYALEEQSRSSVVISSKPRPHLKNLKYRDETLGDFLCRYKKAYFEQFTHFGERNPGGTVEELECHFKGAQKCVYKITF